MLPWTTRRCRGRRRAYFQDAIAHGWLPVRPPVDRPPRVLVTSGVNPLRRWPVPQVIERVLWPKLKLIVAIDTRLSTTGLKADLMLPAAGYYEKRGIKYAVALAPYVVIGDQAVAPLGESKPEWEIMALLARRLQERARERGMQRRARDDLRPLHRERPLRSGGRRRRCSTTSCKARHRRAV